MKKIIILILLILLIPYILVILFFHEKEIKFDYNDSLIVRVKRNNDILKVYLEDYIVGVIAGELPITFSDEAFKAQAVAARTYVLKKINYNIDNNYDVTDTTNDQVYYDYEYLKKAWGIKFTNKINKLKKAVIETNGEYLTYDGKIIDAFFFSTSSGFTENSEDVFGIKAAYLKSVKSDWDSISPVYNYDYKFLKYEFYEKLKINYSDKLSIEIIDITSNGRTKNLKINNNNFTSPKIRELLNLKSSYFDITEDNNYIYVKTKGYGHGVGLSQYGAEAMSRLGYKYDEILKYYYKGVKLEKY